ncbi:MAG TPA: penicillin-binding protein 2 [Acidimicrobiales bacterium]|nr:penicillin-binding protein 2 [Acidimicrobiales bacterium]
MTADSPRLRLGIIAVVAVSLFAALFARMWFLQVLTAGEHELAAAANQRRVIPIPAPRGRILDRNGEILVANRASNVVTVDRSALRRLDGPDQERVIESLAAVVDRPPFTLWDRLDDQRLGPFTPVPVAEDLPEEVLIELRERKAEFPGVTAQQSAVRDYPHGSLAAHLLGYVGAINSDELEAAGGVGGPSGYRLTSRLGKEGIERTFEEDLRGHDGEVILEVDANDVPIRELSRREPVPGNDVILAIDLETQRVAERALAQGMSRAQGSRDPETGQPVTFGGSSVVLDVREGTVTAMASWPTFDPGDFVYQITPGQFAELTDPARGTPFVNRAVLGQYAPGSTWKLVTALAGIEAGLVTPETTILDGGRYVIPDCARNCTRQNAGRAAYGEVALAKSLTVSSDVYYYGLGARFWQERERLGDTPIQDMAARLGFGTPTGVPLPTEAAGRLASPALRAQAYAENPELFLTGDWFIGDNVNISIGQGDIAVTPIQLANAYATFATGGTRHQPNLALRVQDPQGDVVRQIAPRPVDAVALPAGAWGPMVEGFIGATASEDPRGTAYNAFRGFPHDQFPVAGKTGTAQNGGDRKDDALFAAFAPADDPRYALSVVMERAGFGSTWAAPVARSILSSLSGLDEPDGVEPVAGNSG